MTKEKTPEPKAASGQLRFVLDPSHRVVCDLKGNLPAGEAVWLAVRKSEVQRACDSGQFKTLHPQAEWAADLPDRVAHAMLGRVVDHLSLARRSGAVIPGFEKVKAALEQRKLALVMQAGDAAEDGRLKLSKIAGHLHVPEFSVLSGAMLGMVMGRAWQVHVGIKPGGLADQLIALCRMIEDYERS